MADTAASDVDVDDLGLSEEDLKNTAQAATKALAVIKADKTNGLERIQRYLDGQVDGPYIPTGANAEYRLIAERSVSNWLIPALNAPAQSLYVESHRLPGQSIPSPAFEAWQRNRLDGRQADLYRDALSLEQSFVAVKKIEEGPLAGKAKALLLSRMKTCALWEDPVNDERPAFVLHVLHFPTDKVAGSGWAWDREHMYTAVITEDEKTPVTLTEATIHGFGDCPVIPFSPYRDLTGKPRGIIKPLLPIQDRINQSIFDLMIAQQFGAFKVRYITGMVPPPKRQQKPITLADALTRGLIESNDPEYTGRPAADIIGYEMVDVVDADGNPIPDPLVISPSRMLIIEDEHAKVGELDETGLADYIASIEMSVQHLASIAQVPPQLLTGVISNLAADALAALAASLARMVSEFQHSFGESWEQVFQLFAECEGLAGSDVFNSEVIWRDTTSRSLAQVVDALGKASTMLDIPGPGLWSRIPGVTAGDIMAWTEMADDRTANYQANGKSNLARSISPANSSWAKGGARHTGTQCHYTRGDLMASEAAAAITARELAELHRVAQERLGLSGAILSLGEWSGVNILAPTAGGAWFAKLVTVTTRLRHISRRLAVRYYNLARAISVQEALPDPTGGDYGASVTLSHLYEDFGEVLREVIEAVPAPDFQAEPQPPTAPDPTVLDDSPLSREDDLDRRVDDLVDELRAAFDAMKEQFPDEEVPVAEDFDWPELDEGHDFEAEYKKMVEDELKELDDAISRLERDEDLSAAEFRKKMEATAEDASYKMATLVDVAVMTSGRDVVDQAGTGDTLVQGWMRITGPRPCAFCAMLASRGAVYGSESSALLASSGTKTERRRSAKSGANKKAKESVGLKYYHPNCHCHVIPVFKNAAYSKRDKFFMDNWSRVTAGNSGKDALNAWRRWLNRQYKEGTVPLHDTYGPEPLAKT